MATDFQPLLDYSAGTVVELPNHMLGDTAAYRDSASPYVGGITRFHLEPMIALDYTIEMDGRAIVDPTWNQNPGLSFDIPVGDLQNQGRVPNG